MNKHEQSNEEIVLLAEQTEAFDAELSIVELEERFEMKCWRCCDSGAN